MPIVNGPVDWEEIDLVVFDMDGTLYDQSPLRRRMLRELLTEAFRTRTLAQLALLRAFRRQREMLAEIEARNFRALQFDLIDSRPRCSVAEVQSLVAEWIERRPLRHLAQFRAPGVDKLFRALRRAGKKLAIWSDYPAREKLAVLGLEADWVAEATDPAIDRLKPHPAGLEWLLRQSAIPASRVLLIGDRPERDGVAGGRLGVRTLIRSRRKFPGFDSFVQFLDPPFAELLGEQVKTGSALAGCREDTRRLSRRHVVQGFRR